MAKIHNPSRSAAEFVHAVSRRILPMRIRAHLAATGNMTGTGATAWRSFWSRRFFFFIPAVLMLISLAAFFGREDNAVIFFEQLHDRSPLLTRFAILFSRWGSILLFPPYAFLAIRGIASRDWKNVRFVACVFVVFCLGHLVSCLGKYIVGRPRPGHSGGFIPFSSDRGHHSFPSGHTVDSLSLAFPLGQRAGSVAALFFFGVIPGLMAASRLYLGQHYPSDILGSLVIGCATGIFFDLLSKKYNCESMDKQPQSPS